MFERRAVAPCVGQENPLFGGNDTIDNKTKWGFSTAAEAA